MKWARGVCAVGGLLAVGTWGAGQVPGGPPRGSGGPPSSTEPGADKPAAGERVADYAQRQRSLKNLRQIALALINYPDPHNRFPADITDKAGKALLSWRVELLPFMDEDNLYKQLHRDEPWDSPHNMKLLAKMPDVYRVAFDPKDATHTYYQRFAIASNTAFVPPGGINEGGSAAGPAGPPAGVGPPPPMGGGPGRLGVGSAAGPPPGTGPMGGPVVPEGPRFPLRMTEITDGTSVPGVIEAGRRSRGQAGRFVYDATQPPAGPARTPTSATRPPWTEPSTPYGRSWTRRRGAG